MRDFIKQALTKTIQIRTAQGDTQQLELAPDKKILYGMYFALAALIMLTALETTHRVALHIFNGSSGEPMWKNTVGFRKRRLCSNVVVSKSKGYNNI